MLNRIVGEVTYFFHVRKDAIAGGTLNVLSDWCLTEKGWMPRPQKWISEPVEATGKKMVDASFDRIKPWSENYGEPVHRFNEMPIKMVRVE